MSERYSIGVATPAAAAGAPYMELKATATDRLRIIEIGMFVQAATATSVALVRNNAVGTFNGPLSGLANDPAAPTSTGTVGILWTGAPTVQAQYLRRMIIPAAIGNGLIWTFNGELIVPINGSLVLWNFGAAAGSICSAYIVWDE